MRPCLKRVETEAMRLFRAALSLDRGRLVATTLSTAQKSVEPLQGMSWQHLNQPCGWIGVMLLSLSPSSRVMDVSQ